MTEIIKTIIEEQENEVTVFTKNDDSYSIAPANHFVGGDGIDGYICDGLGSVAYKTMESVLLALEKWLKADGDEITDYEYC